MLSGLGRRRKAIPCRFLYDRRGSELFERICTLPEYPVTRAETALLAAHRHAIAERLGPDRLLVDFGAGSAGKTRQLLAALERPLAYVPVDIARDQLRAAAAAVARDHPGLRVAALCADYTRRFRLPPGLPGRPAGFFPGSTIGNFTPAEARRFLAATRRVLAGGPLLIGIDLEKPEPALLAAYDDRAGVTAAFNLNLLSRINRELGADFRPDRFHHRALYRRRHRRIEMHLVSRQAQTVRVAGQRFTFGEGESIHTENSYKFTPERFIRLAAGAGWAAAGCWQAEAGFALVLLCPADAAAAA